MHVLRAYFSIGCSMQRKAFENYTATKPMLVNNGINVSYTRLSGYN